MSWHTVQKVHGLHGRVGITRLGIITDELELLELLDLGIMDSRLGIRRAGFRVYGILNTRSTRRRSVNMKGEEGRRSNYFKCNAPSSNTSVGICALEIF